MPANLRKLLILFIRFSPLAVSPDKIGRNHNNINRHTYRKKTNREIILLSLLYRYRLLSVGCSRTIR